jgi:hypothetical protein
MQVSTIAELDTHVIIGGGEAKAFGMDDSPELYALLSDKIYRDKKRAAMRETICNAWDAHIMVGKTDVPVEITVTDTEIEIRDFGPGIPDDLMHPIYCVYGKSTKVKDANQTGGFGLGSKAPFAVTDHFNVVSQHAGFKTVYAISRGGATTDGKPDMRAMVRVPTDATGITVTIPLRDKSARIDFEQHIRAVVKQGGILANLNGIPLERYDYAEARKTEYCVLPSSNFHEGKVYVLYGTVMYPLTTTDEKLLKLANEALHYTGRYAVLVLIAPPNSVGVTPSRESLSYSDLTDETLRRLLTKARKQLESEIPAARKRYLVKWIETYGRQALKCNFSSAGVIPGILSTTAMIADHAVMTDVHSHAPLSVARRQLCKIAGKMFRDDRRFYRRAIKRNDTAAEYNFRRTAMPMIRIASKMGLLKDLMLFDIYRYSLDLPGPKTKKIGEFLPEGHVYPVLCVARNLRDLRPTLSGIRGKFYGREENHYIPGVVLRQWTEKNLKTLRDLCDRYKIELEVYDYEEAKRNRAKPVRREKIEEKYIALEAYNHGFRNVVPSCSEPAFYMMTWQRDDNPRLPFDAHLVKSIAAKYPNTVLITTKQQEEKLKKIGVRNLAEVAAERLVELTKVREVIYGEAIRHSRMVSSKDSIHYNSIPDVALKLSKMDMRLAKLLFPDRATPGDAHKEAALLWDFLTGATSLSEETQKIVNEAREKLRKVSAETFKPVRASDLEKRFEYLVVLRGSNIIGSTNYSPKTKLADDLIETIKFLQRRHAKSLVTDHSKPAVVVANTLKEAA